MFAGQVHYPLNHLHGFVQGNWGTEPKQGGGVSPQRKMKKKYLFPQMLNHQEEKCIAL
jgi:hypothetical protein